MRKLLCVLVLALCAQVSFGTVVWTDTFDTYTGGSVTTWATGTPWNTTVAGINFAGTNYLTSAGLTGNTTNKLTGRTASNYGYQSWLSRDFGTQIQVGEKVTVTAQVAQTLNGKLADQVGWPLSDHIFLSNVGIGIADGDICYGILNYGYTATNTVRPYTDVTVIDGQNWYDVKIVVTSVAGTNNDTADLYYKKASDSQWITVVQGLNTEHDLDGKVYYHGYNYNGVYMGYMDNVELSIVPEPATMLTLGLGSLLLVRKRRK